MFDNLIESKRKTQKGRFMGVGFVSVTLHTGIIAAAVYATLSANTGDNKAKVDTTVVFLQQQQQKQPDQPPPPTIDVPLKGFQTVVAITDIPKNIPPVNLQEHFDPKDFSGAGVEGGVATGMTPSTDQVFSADVVQEKPEVLSGPPPQYPELLRQAGIQGVVMVQAVVDTSGRVEPNSLKIVTSANPGFDANAKQTILKTLFRPARVYGHAVRVLIQIPVNFTLTHH
ncbi:MAG TPA: energy transducer TonB [Gemmatimonadales bacterium]|nr:energy transducer TonB [Gemmatimonadales bacterium]HWH02629.1 energy transducer TonB [Gemmatimonadales bacterium]